MLRTHECLQKIVCWLIQCEWSTCGPLALACHSILLHYLVHWPLSVSNLHQYQYHHLSPNHPSHHHPSHHLSLIHTSDTTTFKLILSNSIPCFCSWNLVFLPCHVGVKQAGWSNNSQTTLWKLWAGILGIKVLQTCPMVLLLQPCYNRGIQSWRIDRFGTVD